MIGQAAGVAIAAIDDPDERERIAAGILRSLPAWFGRPESTVRYIAEARALPLYAARMAADICGFLALKAASPAALEIHAMGVAPGLHRHGIGRALVERAAEHASNSGCSLLTVKTLGPSHPSREYAATREFYSAAGFVPVEEFPDLWGPGTPCLLMARPLTISRS